MNTVSFSRAFNSRHMKLTLTACAIGLLVGCSETERFSLPDIFGTEEKTETETTVNTPEGEFIEKDVEDPSVFSKSEAGLWDGRPSLGGVWVAHPDVKEPERVMIRNTTNGKFVVGALFRRERAVPGPRLQISSDAAAALGILAGAPVEVSVVALRKERTPVTPPAPVVVTAPDAAAEAPATIEQSTLDPVAVASDAIDAAEPAAVAAAAPTPAVRSTLPESRLAKPYIQVGIYNQEKNAQSVADQMRSAGMTPSVRSQTSGGSPFWRVVVGPAGTAAEQRALQDKIRSTGFADAYPVSN